VPVERDSHLLKHCWQSVSTDEGIQIDESDEQSSNAEGPMDESREPESKITLEIVLQLAKQESPNFVTPEGMQIEERDQQN
jgi:hypothetical protein